MADYISGDNCGIFTLDANGGTIKGTVQRICEADLVWTGEGEDSMDTVSNNTSLNEFVPVMEGKIFTGWYSDTEFAIRFSQPRSFLILDIQAQ